MKLGNKRPYIYIYIYNGCFIIITHRVQRNRRADKLLVNSR